MSMLLSLIAILHKIMITFIGTEKLGRIERNWEANGEVRSCMKGAKRKKKKPFHYFLTVRKTKRLDWNKLKGKCL